jgi:hypothetical protein
MAKRKVNTNDILLYGGLGLASGLAVNLIQDFYLWYFFRKESWDLYNQGVQKYGEAYKLFWQIQKIEIDAKQENWTDEKLISERTRIANTFFPEVNDADYVASEKWYKENCKWLNKTNYFRQRYAYMNYALILAGVIPFLVSMKNQKIKYLLIGSALSGAFNTFRYNFKKYDIYKKLNWSKQYVAISKIFNKPFGEALESPNSLGSWGGYVVWSIVELVEEK